MHVHSPLCQDASGLVWTGSSLCFCGSHKSPLTLQSHLTHGCLTIPKLVPGRGPTGAHCGVKAAAEGFQPGGASWCFPGEGPFWALGPQITDSHISRSSHTDCTFRSRGSTSCGPPWGTPALLSPRGPSTLTPSGPVHRRWPHTELPGRSKVGQGC